MLKFLIGTSLFCFEQVAEGGAAAGTGGGDAAKGAEGGGQQGGGQQQQASTIAWLPPGHSAEDAAYVQSKGWDKETNPAAAILGSYRNLEKVWGADKAGNTFMIPGENADEKVWDGVYNKLGRPESADKYSAGEFGGMSPELSKELKATAHKLGLSEKQMKGLHDWNEGANKKFSDELNAAAQAEFATQQTNLKKEWGGAFDQNLQLAQEATKNLGWTEDQIKAMQVGIGFDGVMKLAHQIGTATGEGSFHTGDKGRAGGSQNNVLSPEQAKAELKRLSTDAEFQKAWMTKTHPRHDEMVRKKSQLSAWAAGEKG